MGKGEADSLYGARVAMRPWVRSRGEEASVVCPPPFVSVVCRGMSSTLLFAPSSSDMAVGWRLGWFWVFVCLFVSCCPSLSQLCTHAAIFSPLQFLCILLRGDICPGASTTCKGSQVPSHLEQRTLAAAAWPPTCPASPQTRKWLPMT